MTIITFKKCHYPCPISLLRLHNETVNVWTHLLGFLYFLCAMAAVFADPGGFLRVREEEEGEGEQEEDRVSLVPLTIQLLTYQVGRRYP